MSQDRAGRGEARRGEAEEMLDEVGRWIPPCFSLGS